jgi:hypothetical protein
MIGPSGPSTPVVVTIASRPHNGAMRRILLTLTLVLVSLAPASCSSKPAPGGILTVPTPTTAGTSARPASPSVAATCDKAPFTTMSITVMHSVDTPPKPSVTAIRPGTHPECGFDRITFDFKGPIPGYSVMAVNNVVRDGSGKAIRMPGARFLLIRFVPATTASLPSAPVALGFPVLRGYAISGDFEGIVSVALGLANVVRVRVGELPGRVYIDVSL